MAKQKPNTKTPTLRSWDGMLQRCTNQRDPRYKDYGGRGITVCERWLKFENFLADMGERPAETSIDRVDNSGNYTPDNCRWATRVQQQNNMRRNHLVTFEGETHTVAEWVRIKAIKHATLWARLKRGWSIRRALETPIQGRITWNGHSLTTKEWIAKSQLTRPALNHRLARGWTLERALTQPLLVRKKKPQPTA